jgi:hypothetical protein
LATCDAKDVQLRHELYSTKRRREPILQIDTSCSSAADVTGRIKAWLRGH